MLREFSLRNGISEQGRVYYGNDCRQHLQLRFLGLRLDANCSAKRYMTHAEHHHVELLHDEGFHASKTAVTTTAYYAPQQVTSGGPFMEVPTEMNTNSSQVWQIINSLARCTITSHSQALSTALARCESNDGLSTTYGRPALSLWSKKQN